MGQLGSRSLRSRCRSLFRSLRRTRPLASHPGSCNVCAFQSRALRDGSGSPPQRRSRRLQSLQPLRLQHRRPDRNRRAKSQRPRKRNPSRRTNRRRARRQIPLLASQRRTSRSGRRPPFPYPRRASRFHPRAPREHETSRPQRPRAYGSLDGRASRKIISRARRAPARRKGIAPQNPKRRSSPRPLPLQKGQVVRHLRIGTRGSLLAKWQAEFVRKRLFAAAGVEAEIVIIKTSGDKFANAPLTQIGGKGIFVKELEDALMDESIDVAVHSVKDIPTEIPPRLQFPAVFRREDVRDCLISASGSTLATLRQGARIGTGSLRRQSQLRHIRPDLDVRDLRGNVDTRLRKAQSGEYDAILLAKAGLDRLGWSDRITETFAPDIFLPAVGQGAIAAECRLSDNAAAEVLGTLDDAESRAAIIAERALLSALQGGCQVPLGAWARTERGEFLLEACVCSVDGAQYVRQRATATPDQAGALGEHVARLLLESGAQSILEAVRSQSG